MVSVSIGDGTRHDPLL